MRTWAICRPGERYARGFTLLELLVVLVILGMVAAIAVPGAIRTIGAWQRQASMDEIVIQVRALPVVVRASGRPLVLEAVGEVRDESWDVLSLPEGWTADALTPLRVESNGACSDARLVFEADGWQRTLAVEAPFCDARWVD